ncbi:MAG: GNAT family N-acetyltransferase [Gemmatimonadales bacterium]
MLRLHFEISSNDAADRSTIAEACRNAGFRQSSFLRSYRRTVWIELNRPTEELLASFTKGCRQSIRAPAKRGYVVREIVDLGTANTLHDILRSTFHRTGGAAPRLPWTELIRLSARPDASVRLVGLFPEGDPSMRLPVSFALAYLHGDVAEYAHAGSVRSETIGGLPLLYAPTWESMQWARSRGARWWDFGGVTDQGPQESSNRLAGVDAFKSAFSSNVIDVGEEWHFERRRTAAMVADTATRLKAWAANTRLTGMRGLSVGIAPSIPEWLTAIGNGWPLYRSPEMVAATHSNISARDAISWKL